VREFSLSFGAESFAFQFVNQKYKDNIYKTIILPFVLYGCATWSLTRWEEHNKPWAFEKRMLRTIFRHKKDEVTEDWRSLHKGELYDLYSSPNIRVIK
jgi:hypothetical protein